jgi:hypothetical protein
MSTKARWGADRKRENGRRYRPAPDEARLRLGRAFLADIASRMPPDDRPAVERDESSVRYAPRRPDTPCRTGAARPTPTDPAADACRRRVPHLTNDDRREPTR